ncbi:DapH/DapD/GlmU-related protein [Candidatus Lokiarchaeum ossiferum]|uniref:DapH/DapD/GlmU-related protein n=1 Tax=Candidatus Lokiarchaeum ossiferum TaxID=2951803 RepID=UPI00352FC866
MSSTVPTTLRAGPATTNTLASQSFTAIYGLIIWLALIPCFFLTTKLITLFDDTLLFIALILPIFIFLIYFIFFVSVVLWSALILKIVNLIHTPKEGIFPRDNKNRDYKFWSLRAVIKKFPLWVCHNVGPFPWTDVFAMKVFGNHVTYKSPVFDAWVDAEFMDIGRGTTIGQGVVIMTSMITTDFLIIKRVKIGKNAVIGAHSVISPGTKIGDNAIIGALSATEIDQEIENDFVYMGNPARKIRKAAFKIKDELSAHERALQKKYDEIKAKIPEIEPKRHIVGTKASLQLHKSEFKEKRAMHHEEKAYVKQAKAKSKARKSEYKIERLQFKADKHIYKAEKQKYESILAMQKAQRAINEKIEKDRHKLQKIENTEREREIKDKRHITFRLKKKSTETKAEE